MAGDLRPGVPPASDIRDFEADANWFLARAWRGVFAVAGVVLGIFLLVNQLSIHFSRGLEISVLGRKAAFPPMEYRIVMEPDWILPVVILSGLVILNRWIAYNYMARETDLRGKRQVFHRFVYAGEIISMLTMKYSGGVESPMFLYFLGHIVALSSVVSRGSLARHIAFLSALFTFVSISEFTGFMAHTNLTDPPLGLYRNGPYVLLITFGVIGYMVYIGVSTSNIFRKMDERRKALAVAEKSDREARLYLDIMSHDLTNFSQALLGNLCLLERTVQGDQAEKYIRKCRRQIDRCERLISRTNVLSELDELSPADIGTVDAAELLREAATEVAAEYPDHNGIVTDVRHPLPVRGTPLLKTVFVSVLENAVEHSGGGAGIKTILQNGNNNENYHVLVIEDNGPGIPGEMKQKIFQRLSGIGKDRGTGLSLSVSKAVVEKFGGAMEARDRVNSDSSGGAAIVISLPKA